MKKLLIIFLLLLFSCIDLSEESIYGSYDYSFLKKDKKNTVTLTFKKNNTLLVLLNSKKINEYYWVLGNNADDNIGFSIFKNKELSQRKVYFADGVHKVSMVEIGIVDKEFSQLLGNKTLCVFEKKTD